MQLPDIRNISSQKFLLFLQQNFDSITIENAFHLASNDCLLESIVIFDRNDLLDISISHYSEPMMHAISSSTNSKSYSLLHLIVLSGSVRLLRSLKGFYAERAILKNLQSKWGETGLHLAAGTGNDVIVQLLIEIGIDESCKDKWGRTAADIAQETGHEKLFKLSDYPLKASFITAKSSEPIDSNPQRSLFPRQVISQEFMKAVSNRKKADTSVTVKNIFSENLETLRQQDIVINQQQSNSPLIRPKLVPLSKLIEYPGDPEKLADLMNPSSPNFNTYDVNGKDMFGLAAIHKISSWNKIDLLDLVLSHPNIDVNLIASGSNSGFSALHFAVDNNAELSYQRLTNDPRININVKDQKGRTSKELAEQLKVNFALIF